MCMHTSQVAKIDAINIVYVQGPQEDLLEWDWPFLIVYASICIILSLAFANFKIMMYVP